MKHKSKWLIILLLVLGLVLVACGGEELPEVVEPEQGTETSTEVVEETVVEPVVEQPAEAVEVPAEELVEEIAEITEADLEAAFGGFLTGMVR